MKKTNKFAESFESWANQVAESWDEDEEGNAQQWGNEPINVDDLADVFAEELPLGVDAVNAVNAISGVINSNELEHVLLHASKQNPEADARDIIIAWLEENVPAVFQELMNEIGDVESELGESDTGDTPYNKMSRNELLDYLHLDPLIAQHIPNEKLRAKAEEKSQDMTEGNTYGSGDGGMDGTVYEEEGASDCCEAIQSAVIRRIINQHKDLLVKHGPQAIMDAARDVAEWVGEVEEIGSSDVSAWVKQVVDQLESQSEVDESFEAMAPADSASPLSHAQEEYCDKCDSAECHCDELEEGKVKAVAIDLEELSDAEFVAKYNKTKEEIKAALGESIAGDDHVNRDVKMKRMGAKELSTLDKLKIMPRQMKAFTKGDSEDDLLHYNKMKSTNEDTQFNEDMLQMRRIAGLIK